MLFTETALIALFPSSLAYMPHIVVFLFSSLLTGTVHTLQPIGTIIHKELRVFVLKLVLKWFTLVAVVQLATLGSKPRDTCL